MKAVLLSAMFFVAVTGQSAPRIDKQQFNCEYKPETNGKWEPRGSVISTVDGQTLRLEFSEGMNSVFTTGTGLEYRVEARCPGSITLSDNKPFKIRDFKFDVVVDDSFIESPQGQMELKVAGWALVNNSNPKDSFDKVWNVRYQEFERYKTATDESAKNKLNPFTAKQESNTVCGSQLTLRFDDLRAVVISDQTSSGDGSPTGLATRQLLINLDPC